MNATKKCKMGEKGRKYVHKISAANGRGKKKTKIKKEGGGGQGGVGGAEAAETRPDSDPNPDQCTFAKGATPRKVGSLYSSTHGTQYLRLCELSGHAVTHETRSRSHLLKDGCCCTGDSMERFGMVCYGIRWYGMRWGP